MSQRHIFCAISTAFFFLIRNYIAYSIDPQTILDQLLENNREYFITQNYSAERDDDRMDKIEADRGSDPWALVLFCAEAQNDPQTFFWAHDGRLVVVRTAGPTIGLAGVAPNDPIVGSIEYLISSRKIPLLILDIHQG